MPRSQDAKKLKSRRRRTSQRWTLWQGSPSDGCVARYPRFAKTYHVAAHLKSVKSRSLAALWIYEIYAGYRLGRNSIDIAQQLGISPWSVRQHLHRLNKVALELFPHLRVPAREYGGPCTREAFLDTKIAKAERRAERASKSKKYCGLVPVYQSKLAELRKMKADREVERQHATLYSTSSANRAAA